MKGGIMTRIKSIAGYAWAFAIIVLILVMFIRNDYFARTLASASGVKVSANWTGGEVVKIVDYGTYRTLIHRPVFDRLIGESKEGFIQIRWEPLYGLPALIEEPVNFSSGAKEDFSIRVDTKTGKTVLVKNNTNVLSVSESERLDNAWLVRVKLKNTK